MALDEDFESWMVLKDKWTNKGNAWKYCELKEEVRSFHGTGNTPVVLKSGTQGDYLGKRFGRYTLISPFRSFIQRNKKLGLLSLTSNLTRVNTL